MVGESRKDFMRSVKTVLALALATVTMLPAQDKSAQAAQEFESLQGLVEARRTALVSAVIPVKTLTGDAFARLVKLLHAFKVSFAADDRLRTILVYGPKDVVEQMKKVVLELDRPGSEAAVGRNVDMTLTFLRCSSKPSATASDPLPPELEAVAKQLRAATQYQHVELWEVLPIRIQEGKQSEQSARLPNKPPGIQGVNTTARIILNPESVNQREGARSVRFDRFNINFRIPYSVSSVGGTNYQFLDVGLNTSGDFKEGQKTVLGKVGLDDDSAVFVVVALKVLD